MNTKLYFKNKLEKYFYKFYKWLKKNRENIIVSILSFMFSMAISFIESLKEGNSFNETVLNFINWKPKKYAIIFSIIVIAFILILYRKMEKSLKQKSMAYRFYLITNNHTSPLFKDYSLEGFGWGANKTFISCPYINEGLTTQDVKINYIDDEYNLDELKEYDSDLKDRDIIKEYKLYKKNVYDKTYDEEDRIMITNRGAIYTDDNQLRISLKKVKYSYIRFFRDVILKEEGQEKYIKFLYNKQDIFIPNNFGLHIVIITADNKILLSKDKFAKYEYKKDWIPSVNCIMKEEDFKTDDAAYAMVKRMLKEELGLEKQVYLKRNIRFFSIYCEGEICNLDFMCIVEINKQSNRLLEILYKKEGIEYDFLDVDCIAKELINPSKIYNSTYDIRLLYTEIQQKGTETLKEDILREMTEYEKNVKRGQIHK